MNLVLKIAAGILLASAIMATTGFAVTALIAYHAQQELERTLAEQQARLHENQRQAQAARQAEADIKSEAERRLRQLKQQQLARERAEREFDRAFANQYVPPSSCINPQSDKRWVECVDLRKKAKQEYELDSQSIGKRGDIKRADIPKS